MTPQSRLIEALAQHFLEGGAFSTILSARREAAAILGETVNPGTALAKLVEESLEAALVRTARLIV